MTNIVNRRLAQQVRDDPLLFVTGLPASPAVDFLLSFPVTRPCALEYHTHAGSLATLRRHRPRVAACQNPNTLLHALERPPARAGKQFLPRLLTNPATPRTDEVRRHTQSLPIDQLLNAFCLQYSSPRRSEFHRRTHTDLLQLVEQAPEELLRPAVEEASWHFSSSSIDPRTPRPRLLIGAGLVGLEDSSLGSLGPPLSKLGSVGTDGTFRVTGLVEERLARWLSHRPGTLTEVEVKASSALLSDLVRSGHRLAPGAAYLGAYMLDHWQVTELDLERILPSHPYPGPVSVERWAHTALGTTNPPPWVADATPTLAKAAGHFAAERLGLEDVSSWSMLVELLQDGWDGTFKQAVDTVSATT